MAKPMDSRDLSNVERDLTDLFSAVSVDAAFMATLERRLKTAQAEAVRAEADSPRPRGLGGLGRLLTQWFSQRRWAVAALGVLLIVMLTVTLIGPQQVWAGFQRLLRDYVPGLGFVNLEQAWMLAEPVEVARDGVVLRVEHLVASPERTVVQIETTGLKQRLGPSRQADPVQTYGQAYDAFEALLRLSDGTRLAVVTKSLRVGGGVLAFPPLPSGVDVSDLVLEIPRLPLLPAGAAPEDWMIPLSLDPAIDSPQVLVYALADVEDTHAGITLGVSEVAHSPAETAVHIWAAWDPAMGQVWIPALPAGGAVALQDEATAYGVQDLHAGSPIQWGHDAHALFGEPGRLDLGRGKMDLGTGTRSRVEDMWVFDPLRGDPYSAPAVVDLTLQVAWFYAYLPTTGMSFTVDLGDNPQDGDRWPLDVYLAVGDDMALHIASVRLTALSASEARSYPDAAWKLSFEIVPEEPEDRFLESVMVMSPLNSLGGGAESRRWISKPEGGWILDEGPILSWMFIPTLPDGPIDVRVSSASMRVQGPWTVTWRVPTMD